MGYTFKSTPIEVSTLKAYLVEVDGTREEVAGVVITPEPRTYLEFDIDTPSGPKTAWMYVSPRRTRE